MWYLLLILSTKLLVFGEILTLINRENITCVLTDSSVYSSLYVASSVLHPIEVRRPIKKLTNWQKDAWKISTSKNHDFYPIIDQRWEDFPKIENGRIRLNQAATAFSLCFKGVKLTLSATDTSLKSEWIHLSKDKVEEDFCKWSHYLVNGSTMYQFLENWDLVNPWEMSFTPTLLIFPRRSVLIKIHEYDFKYLEQTTLNDAISYLDLSNLDQSNSLCISMFVSLDENSHLDVILESGDTKQMRIKGFNNKNNPKFWKRIEIKTDRYNGTGRLHFFRTRDDHTRFGFWAIDQVRICNKVEIFKFQKHDFKNSENFCRTLNTTDTGGVLCNKVGFLGGNCDVDCEVILGSEFPFCENHKICSQNGTCVCSWNHKGLNCNEVIDKNFKVFPYHLQSCENYNKKLGCTKCKERFFGNQCSEKLPVVIEAPKLISITEDSITFYLGRLEHSPDEAQPNFYQIQYKKDDEAEFHNFSSLISYKTINGTVTIGNLSTKEVKYKVRVVLFVGDKFFEGNVPNLFTFQKSLKSTASGNRTLTWDVINNPKVLKIFLLNYECEHNFCPNHTVNGTIKTQNHTATIENVENYNCSIKLFLIQPNEIELVDEIATFPKWSNIRKIEMPKDLVFEKDKMILEFEDCEKFQGPIKYFFKFTCVNCKNNTTVKNIEFKLQTHSNRMEINFENLEPSTTFRIQVVAERGNSTFNSSYLKTTVGLSQKLEIPITRDLVESKSKYIVVSSLCILIVVAVLGILYLSGKFWKSPDHSVIEEMHLLSSNSHLVANGNIKIRHFETYLKSVFLEGDDLRSEFESIPNERDDVCEIGLKSENVNKNRDRNFLPYDKSRVILKNSGISDYINASYIDGYDHPKAYIVCQGPKFSTVTAFWRMIWQENVQTVIMATDFIEKNGNRSCAEYWSPHLRSSCDFGEFTLKMTDEEIYQSYNHRVFDIEYGDVIRMIHHFQIKWSCDLYSCDILPIVKRLRIIRKHPRENSPGPVVVHSSLGINRSGTIVLCDLAVQMAEATESVNFCHLLKLLRTQRPHMITTIEFYKLAQLTLLEFILEKENPFNTFSNDDTFIEKLNFMARLYWLDEALSGVPLIPTAGVLIDGYSRRDRFLLRRQPKKDQISEFWESVMSQKIKCVVFINKLGHKLWPHQHVDSERILNVTHSGNIEITSSSSMSRLLLVTRDASTEEVLHKRELFFFELKIWSSREFVPKSTNSILSVIEDVRKITTLDENPILVACSSQLNQNSLFVILFSIIEMYDQELETEIPKLLRVVKRRKPDFSIHLVQLKFLYSGLFDYLNNFDHYKHIYATREDTPNN